MKVRKFVGKSTKEAMDKVRRELGDEAVILHTKKRKKPGFLGMFGKEEVEILAALDAKVKKKAPSPKAPAPRAEREEIQFVERARSQATPQYRDEIIPPKKVDMGTTDELSDIKQSIEYIAEKLKLRDLGDTLSEFRDFIKVMVENGVEEEVARDIVENVSKQVVLENKTKDEIREIVRLNIKSYLGEVSSLKYDGEKKVIFFIGPTGVGKTTTLAKLASHFVLNEKCSIGLITADTYRIGAVDQLKIYGEILDIPVKTIYETNEVYEALSGLRDKDVVFIDTAGRSHKNKPQVEELKELINTVKSKEIYLLLNIGTEMKNINSIIKEYDFIEDYSIIFTKKDETDILGNILNTRYYSNKKLSYITTGQNVPDDIELIDTDKISRILVGEADE
ncbi:flagellar biosynthesis protein FlhF [Andreesenia angusta]|uniref:Flagellar biosynthesis protein FlhF n=1 Tax=Andreesenia angusta TaxID=39480 RepID=A0A1S1V9H4_9FIRM|nr:flagellar biosynthesis protein FlhF [Andreesenia angusta]OHW62777.1 flagellar biosynthesis protein FlhF [Andreesenia angusta]